MFKILKPYIVTLTIVMAFGCFKVFLTRFLNIESPILLFFTAVTLCAWYGGALQGLLGIVTSVIFIVQFFVLPDMTAPPEVWALRMFLYFVDSGLIVFICSSLRNSKFRADAAFRELKTVDKNLRHSEERLRRIFDSNMIGIVFSRIDGTLNHANDYFLNLVGVSRDELEKGTVNWKTMNPNSYMELSEQSMRDLQVTGVTSGFEKEFVRPDGTPISVYVRAASVDPNEVVAFVLDISDRKKAENELAEANAFLEERVSERTLQLTEANKKLSLSVKRTRESSEKLRESQSFLDSVVENIPNMIFVKEAANLSFVRFNKAGLDLLKQPSSALIGKSDRDFFPEKEANFFTEKDREVLQGKKMVEIFEEPMSTPEGMRYLHTKKIPILDKHGEPQYLLGISEDITEKKALETQKIEFMEARVARMEAEKTATRLQFLAEASANLNKSLDIYEMLNAFGLTVTKNMADACLIDFFDEDRQTIERMVTAYGEKAKQPGLEDWSHKNKLGAVHQNDVIAQVIKEIQPKIFENVDSDTLLQTLKDPEVITRFPREQKVSMIVVPMVYHDKLQGTITMICGDPLRVYKEIDLSLALDLSKRASLAIENARLFRRANEASRAKSAFLANISHEIRTPLGAMLGFTELALADVHQKEDVQHTEYLSTILRNGQQLLRIVDEVLDLSKAESGQFEMEKIAFPIQKLLDDVFMLMNIKASEKDLTLTIKPRGKLPERLISDPSRLRQIMINIIGNAIKFTQAGQIEVLVSLREKKSKQFLEIMVRDTGLGISPEQAEKLFQPFVQADNSTTRKYGGTGLGLFLARRLAQLMGGDVILKKSEMGKGSEFHILVEVAFEEAQRSTSKYAYSSIEERPSEELSTDRKPHENKVLIVDDSEDNRVMLGAYMEKTHLNFDTAENGLEGVEKAMNEDYDIILMDIQMPKMDGFEAVKYLRDKNYTKPVVAITAHAMKGYKERCLNNGFDDYLCKPLSWASLNDCLNKFIVH